jgi:hypothetical protein
MICNHIVSTGTLKKDEFIRLPYNMSEQLVYGPAMVSMTSRISMKSCMLCSRKYKVTATSKKFINFTTRQCKHTHIQVICSLSRYQRKWAYSHAYCVRQTEEQLNVLRTLYGKPR